MSVPGNALHWGGERHVKENSEGKRTPSCEQEEIGENLSQFQERSFTGAVRKFQGQGRRGARTGCGSDDVGVHMRTRDHNEMQASSWKAPSPGR